MALSSVNQALINKEKVCYVCNKKGHTKYRCKEAGTKCETCIRDGHIKELQSDTFQSCLEYNYRRKDISNPATYYLNCILIQGISINDRVNLHQIIKALLRKLNISDVTYKQYEVTWKTKTSVAHRPDEILWKFHEIKVKERVALACCLYDGFYYNPYANNTKLNINKQLYTLGFRNELPPLIDKLYDKVLRLKAKFEPVVVWIGPNGTIFARRKHVNFYVISKDDAKRLQHVLLAIRKNEVDKIRASFRRHMANANK